MRMQPALKLLSPLPACMCVLRLQDVMFAFDRSKLKDWVNDIKALIAKDLRGIPGWGAHTR